MFVSILSFVALFGSLFFFYNTATNLENKMYSAAIRSFGIALIMAIQHGVFLLVSVIF